MSPYFYSEYTIKIYFSGIFLLRILKSICENTTIVLLYHQKVNLGGVFS